jgi:hypothetical protein
VPRQLPLLLGCRGELRLRRGGAPERAPGGRLLHGVGRRALGWLRAAPLPPQGQEAGRPRARHHEAGRAGVEGRAEEADRGGLSPQCGFSSTVEGNLLTYDDQVAKLRLIVETAEEVWG